MKQFLIILGFELKNFFKNKIFILVTVLMVIAIALVMFFPRLSAIIEESEIDISDEKSVMYIVGDNADNVQTVTSAFSASFADYEVKTTDKGIDWVKEQITSNKAECAFVIHSLNSYEYLVNNLSMYDENTLIADETLQSIYRLNAMVSGGIDEKTATAIMSAGIEHNTTSLGKNQVQNFFYTYIMIFALYMVILLYGQMITTSVATEKSSRAMELLITSANPISMMFGKVISACLAGFTQLFLIFGSSILFHRINKSYWDDNPIVKSIFDMPISLFIYMLVFFLLGFFIYAFLYGAIGSTVSKLEDVNTAVMPLTMVFVFSLMAVITSMTSGSVDSILMKVLSFIPLTSPMAMFTRIAMSTVPVWEIATSIGILVVSVILIGILAAKIYRVGVLLYGTAPKPSAIIKAIRKA